MLDFRAPPFPPATPLDGRYARLEPLDVAVHGDQLWAALAGHDHVWSFLPIGPMPDAATYLKALHGMASRTDIVPYAVIDRADGLAKGHLWLMEIRPVHGVVEVGFITFSPALQRTRISTEAIFLVAERCFALGYRRFEWKCNNRNEPSKRAALRFGFTFEGVFRQHMVVKGQNRDTAWYAMLDHEWPSRRRAFETWLADDNFDEAGRQIRPLEDVRAALGLR